MKRRRLFGLLGAALIAPVLPVPARPRKIPYSQWLEVSRSNTTGSWANGSWGCYNGLDLGATDDLLKCHFNMWEVTSTPWGPAKDRPERKLEVTPRPGGGFTLRRGE
jgi:hypothetical protein